jgi:hypothetical protein
MHPKHLDTKYKKYLFWARKERELISKIKNQPYINIKPYKEGMKLVPYLREDVRDTLLEEFFDKFIKDQSVHVYKEIDYSNPNINRYLRNYKYFENHGLVNYFNDTVLTEADLVKFSKFISYKDRLIIHIIDSYKIKYKRVPYYVYAIQSHDGSLYSELNYIRKRLNEYEYFYWPVRKENRKKEKSYIKAETKRLIKEYYNSDYEALEEFNDYVGDKYSGFPEFKHLWSKINI